LLGCVASLMEAPLPSTRSCRLSTSAGTGTALLREPTVQLSVPPHHTLSGHVEVLVALPEQIGDSCTREFVRGNAEGLCPFTELRLLRLGEIDRDLHERSLADHPCPRSSDSWRPSARAAQR